MATFLPLVDTDVDGTLLRSLARLGPLVLKPALVPSLGGLATNRYIFFDREASLNLDEIVQLLDQGADKVIIPIAWAKEVVGTIPAERIILLLDLTNVSAVSDKLRNGVSGVLIKTPSLEVDFITSVSRFFTGATIHVLPDANAALPSPSIVRELRRAGAIPVLHTSALTLSASTTSQLNIGDLFTAPLISDRPDGLFPTVVTEDSRSLGLVYSSIESIKESITSGKGVYQSRKHGLWRKGETSGATQEVLGIRVDCDLDALEFSVVQKGSGFCHLNRPSCFGESQGIAALQRTLQSRLASAPEGSYTQRLFKDPQLLRAKIMEEADELCRAESKEEVAFEAADLLYFALTRCVAAGVNIADVELALDKKAKKVTRRPGNAKAQWVENPKPATTAAKATPKPTTASIDPDAPIRMRSYDLSTASLEQRAAFLRRPVLKSDEMIAKVKPIVDDVRKRGDAALLELTAKFDKAQLTSTVIFPPFSPETMQLEPKIKAAIDVAYANVHKFHAAQIKGDTLVVETMPGVVCSRFSRPIARVGLYVPGGTAILPSTALMLGVPAQVAGCKEIVIATPPRLDGSISPEVMYVAHLVGASALLKAGGGQAVAALAYGTETVPKVDKIFGPGNQWVTAAKMLVQNDTDALVSIDMPAGPSEVLVSRILWLTLRRCRGISANNNIILRNRL